MKQILVMTLFSCFILAGCQDGNNDQQITDSPQINKEEPVQGAFSLLPAAEVIESSSSGETKNINRFYAFLENTNEKEPDHIQIIQFTTEGDPVYQDIQFDGSVFTSTVNSSRDKYGSGGVRGTVCTDLTTAESAERIDYLLEGCENQEENLLLVVWK